MGGYSMTRKEVNNLPPAVLDFGYPVQVFDNFYIGPKTTKDLNGAEMFNHSCGPNAGVKGQVVLVARRNINPGEEICFDYETTDTVDLKFDCECGAKDCRKKIDGSSWKKKNSKEKIADIYHGIYRKKLKTVTKSINSWLSVCWNAENYKISL